MVAMEAEVEMTCICVALGQGIWIKVWKDQSNKEHSSQDTSV